MTDVLTQEGNTNNEIPADSASLQIQGIANILVPKILEGVNERLPNLVKNTLSQKGFVSTAGYDDESVEEESDRDTGAQNNQSLGTQVPNKPVIGTLEPNKQLKI